MRKKNISNIGMVKFKPLPRVSIDKQKVVPSLITKFDKDITKKHIEDYDAPLCHPLLRPYWEYMIRK